MPFRNDGEGLHRSVDPADGKHYVYGMSFMDAAPTIFACFDQPDLKAPYTFHVRAPQDWVVIGNAPGRQVEKGVWEFEQSQPLSTYFVTLVAGPYHVIRDEHDGIPLGLSARASIAADLDKDAEELFTLTKQSFDELHRLFGIRYPFGDYHQAFVPEFNAGAMENPGLRDVPRSADLHQPGHPWRPHRARHHPRARDGAPVVRQPGHPGVVGRPVAQRVVRRIHGQPGHRRRHRVRRRVGRQRLRASPVGPGRRPAAEHPPGRRQRRGRRERGAAGLRRDLLRQGLRDPAPGQRHARRRGVLQGHHRPLREPPLRQRHDARPLRELGAGRSRGHVELHRQLAAHRRPGPDRARPRGRRRTPDTARGPSGGPAAPHPRGRRRTPTGPGPTRCWRSTTRRPRSTPATGRCCSTPTTTPGRC